MDTKIKLGAVSYLNTLPLLYGIEHSSVADRISLQLDYPAAIAKSLQAGILDIGLVPVAMLKYLPEYHIVSDYGIAAHGPVASVCIFSDCPLEEAETLLLDYQSNTSVALAKILMRDYWKKDIVLEDTEGDEYLHRISGKTAGVVIGDRALEQRSRSKYIYDLAEAWHDWTGLGFVFAAWVSIRPMDESFRKEFNAANAAGLEAIDKVVDQHPYPAYNLHTYYTKNIQYRLDVDCLEGMRLFLSLIS